MKLCARRSLAQSFIFVFAFRLLRAYPFVVAYGANSVRPIRHHKCLRSACGAEKDIRRSLKVLHSILLRDVAKCMYLCLIAGRQELLM
jgi:hypothetical protein